MKNTKKTKKQLAQELEAAYQRVMDLERTEEALKQSQEFTTSLMDNAPNPITVVNSDTSIEYVNPAFEKLTGFTLAEIAGMKTPYPWWLEENKTGNVAELKVTMASGSRRVERMNQKKNGERFWVDLSMTPIMHNRALKYYLANWVDITERKQAEEALRAREKRFSDIAENALEWIWEVDVNGKYTYSSPVVEKILGYKPEEIIEKHFYDLFPAEEREELKKAAFETFARKQPFREFTNPNMHKNGDIVLLLTSGTPIIDKEGKLLGYRGTDTDITERRRAEEATRESEEFSRSLLENAPNPIFVVNPDASIRYVNPAFEKLTGFTSAEATGRKAPFPWWPEERAGEISADFKEYMRSGTTRIERTIRKKNGELSWTAMSSVPVIYRGTFKYLLVNWVDVTEHKRAEKAMANEVNWRRILIEQSRDGIVVLDQNGNVYETNRRFAEMLGYSPEEARQLHVWDWEFMIPREQVIDMIRSVDETGDHFVTQHLRKDGTVYDVEISTNGAVFEGQKLVFCVCRDITERKQAEEALQQSEEKFSKAFRASPDAIAITTFKDGIFLDVNDSFTRINGYTREELIGHGVLEFNIWNKAEDRNRMVQMLKERGRVDNEEFAMRAKSGRILASLFSAEPINVNGQACLISISTDITKRKQAEEQLKEVLANLEHSSAQLAATNKELEAFSYSVSHDLRAPLRTIDGFSQALLEDYADKLEEQGKDYLQRVRAASQRMGALIDDILKLSRLSRSQMHREPVDLSALSEEIAAELRLTQPHRQVEFVIGQGLTTIGDQQLLRVALVNLLGNAWKFTGKHPRARIDFGVSQNGDGRTYFVRDNGAGFDMTYASKMFGAFQRLHDTADFPGTGVGLATVQRIIHRHGGRIWAEGVVGEGATFYFTLKEEK